MTTALTFQATALQTFDIRPTSASLPANQKVDELMIQWGPLPTGTSASIYLPAVNADDVLKLAARMYVTQRFSRVDDHTLTCPAAGITYLPIPKGSGPNYAGLLSLTFPEIPSWGRAVTIRQLGGGYTTDANTQARSAPPPAGGVHRRVLGTFQINFATKPRADVLVTTARLYAIFLWIQKAIPPANRWYPVFLRYLPQMAAQIVALGGNPGQIQPSPTGQIPGLPTPTPTPRPAPEAEEFVGKIEGIAYDHFGDFGGFVLETDSGHHHRFTSRELAMHKLIRQAWFERTRVAVVAEPRRPHVPRSVILLAGAPQFGCRGE